MPQRELKPHLNQRKRFRGRFGRYGTKSVSCDPERTIVLVNIECLDGKEWTVVADHSWLNLTTEFAAIELRLGDVVEFDATVRTYWRGVFTDTRYKAPDDGPPLDYCLLDPAEIIKVAPDVYNIDGQSCTQVARDGKQERPREENSEREQPLGTEVTRKRAEFQRRQHTSVGKE